MNAARNGPYNISNYSVTFTGVFTHTTPTDAYRGAGRPEATYVIERTMDALAAELGIDPVELRRRNFITEFPAQLASGLTIDSGDYHASLDRLLELLDLDSIREEQAARRARGDHKQLGVGFSTYTEMCLIPAACSTFSRRWIARVRSSICALRRRVRSRSLRISGGGTKLGRTSLCSTS